MQIDREKHRYPKKEINRNFRSWKSGKNWLYAATTLAVLTGTFTATGFTAAAAATLTTASSVATSPATSASSVTINAASTNSVSSTVSSQSSSAVSSQASAVASSSAVSSSSSSAVSSGTSSAASSVTESSSMSSSSANSSLPATLASKESLVQNGWDSTQTHYYVNGQVVTGQKNISGHWYLFDKTTGAVQTSFQNLVSYGQNKIVYYNTQGQMIYGLQTINSSIYLFDNITGQMQTGQQYVNRHWYLFDKNSGKAKTGFQNLVSYGQNKIVYYNAAGQMLYGLQTINSSIYLLDNITGQIKTGQRNTNGHWYLFDKNSGKAQTGFQNLASYGQNKIVYYNSEGQMLYGLQTINSSIYLFDSITGQIQTGQRNINGYWYLFDKNSGKAQTGFQNLASYGQNKTVYYNSDGQMSYGLQQINGYSIFFNTITGASDLTVDISSYQGNFTQADFNAMSADGVVKVVVKLTEGTSYTNPYAASQIAMAKAAGMQVAVYDYANLGNAQTQATANYWAQQEAIYINTAMNQLHLGNIPVIFDVESNGVDRNIVDWTKASLVWANQLHSLGKTNTNYYSMGSWTGNGNYMEPQYLGAGQMWVAAYPTSASQINSLEYTNYGAWQFTDSLQLPGVRTVIDGSFDYLGIL